MRKIAEITADERRRTHRLRKQLGIQHKEPDGAKPEIFDRLTRAAGAKGFQIETLGTVWGKPILLFTRPRVDGPSLLIAAGVHGEEPGGVWGVLDYLESTPETEWDHINVAFLPLVSPTAFLRGKRFNIAGHSANANYIHARSNAKLSAEAKILKNRVNTLATLARDGFLTLHEDGDYLDTFYVYTFEHEKDLPLAHYLREVGLRHFRAAPDDDDPQYGKRRNAIIDQHRSHHDGTLEDLLFHAGARHTATTETPVNFDIEYRARANSDLIRAFVGYHRQNLGKEAGGIPLSALAMLLSLSSPQAPREPVKAGVESLRDDLHKGSPYKKPTLNEVLEGQLKKVDQPVGEQERRVKLSLGVSSSGIAGLHAKY